MRLSFLLPVALVAIAAAAEPTSAAIVAGTFTFSASDFNPPGSGAADPATGSFTVLFDNSSDQPALAVSSFSTNLIGYSLGVSDYSQFADSIDFRLINGGENFILVVDGASSLSPDFRTATYEPDPLAGTFTGTVSFTPATASMPEPASMALLCTALVGAGLTHRRKRHQHLQRAA